MKAIKTKVIAAALVVIAGGFQLAQADDQPVRRTDLVQSKLDVQGQEAIQVRVDFAPGAIAARHSHPGEEIAHVLKGTLEYQLGDAKPVTLQAGQSLFIPTGVVHSAKNVGKGQASELATYIVREGETLVVPEKR